MKYRNLYTRAPVLLLLFSAAALSACAGAALAECTAITVKTQ